MKIASKLATAALTTTLASGLVVVSRSYVKLSDENALLKKRLQNTTENATMLFELNTYYLHKLMALGSRPDEFDVIAIRSIIDK